MLLDDVIKINLIDFLTFTEIVFIWAPEPIIITVPTKTPIKRTATQNILCAEASANNNRMVTKSYLSLCTKNLSLYCNKTQIKSGKITRNNPLVENVQVVNFNINGDKEYPKATINLFLWSSKKKPARINDVKTENTPNNTEVRRIVASILMPVRLLTDARSIGPPVGYEAGKRPKYESG